MASAAE